ncbi:Hypothetical predicted protein, partial [Pelobates cultripes]
ATKRTGVMIKLHIYGKRLELHLNEPERRALKELTTAADLIIKPSDKGGNVVLMDKEQYLEMCMEHLRDTQAYQKLTKDPSSQFLNELKSIITPALDNRIITQDEFKFILPHLMPTIATLYCLPKVHKNINKPSGRPIVSGNGSITERSSKYLEKLLHPIVLRQSLPGLLERQLNVPGGDTQG